MTVPEPFAPPAFGSPFPSHRGRPARFYQPGPGSAPRRVAQQFRPAGRVHGVVHHFPSSPGRRRSTEELDEDAAAAIEDPGNNPEVTMQNRQKTEILLKCLTQLSPTHREVIDLVYYHERSIDEVAEIIGVPQNTVKTRMFYARKRIAELMAAQGIDRAIV